MSTNAFALLSGMMLDQQFPMERAFAGPAKILDRFGTLDPATIADGTAGGVRRDLRGPAGRAPVPGLDGGPAPGARRATSSTLRRRRRRAVGRRPTPAAELFKRLSALPGFGKQKAQIFVALLGKQLGRAARRVGGRLPGLYAEEGSYRSVADVRDAASLEKVRGFKKEQKAAAKAR